MLGLRPAMVIAMVISGESSRTLYFGNHADSFPRRNLGILLAFLMAFILLYLTATEIFATSNVQSAGEVLVFRGKQSLPTLSAKDDTRDDEEMSKVQGDTTPTKVDAAGESKDAMDAVPAQCDTFTWRDVTYDIKIKDETRRLLDHVSGWVKPGTSTALMGVSGAGKTTFLHALAQRTTVGVITGDMLVNGRPLESSFQRSTDYVQQQVSFQEMPMAIKALGCNE